MNRSFFCAAASSLALTLLLAGCGGSGFGGGGGSSTSGAGHTFSGVVVDGYIQGATVFLDLNGNLSQDAGEPSATTAAGGTYALVASSLTSDQQAKIAANQIHLVVSIPKTAKDADDGDRTLEQAGKAGFTLMTPASQPKVISPLTTLVSSLLIRVPIMDIEVAKSSVRASLNLLPLRGETQIDVMQDIGLESAATNVKNTAMAVAIALGTIEDALKTGSSSLTTAPTDQQIRLATLEQFNQNISTRLLGVVDTASATRPTPMTVNSALTTLKETLSGPNGAQSAIDAITHITLATANLSSGVTYYHSHNLCVATVSGCEPQIYRTAITPSSSSVTGASYQLNAETSAWVTATNDIIPMINLSTKAWTTASSNFTASLTLDSTGSSAVWTDNDNSKQFLLAALRQTNISDMNIANVSGLGSLRTNTALSGLVFPTGSMVYYVQSIPLTDHYSTSSSEPLTIPLTTTPTNLSTWMRAYLTTNSTASRLPIRFSTAALGNQNAYLTFTPSAPNSDTGTVAVYKTDNTADTTKWDDGIGTYEIRSLDNIKVLVITQLPISLREKYNSGSPSGQLVFLEKDGKVFPGSLFAGKHFSTPLTYARFNKTAFDAILAQFGHPATPTH